MIVDGEQLAISIARVATAGGPSSTFDARVLAVLLFVQARTRPEDLDIEAEPRTTTINDVRDAFRLSQSTASVLVNKMIDTQWLMRKRSRFDHRMYPLALTPKALQMLRRSRVKFDTRDVTDE